MTDGFKARLSAEQVAVATHLDGPLLVEAGPGSGKTRVLTERIRLLLTTVPGHFRILALTFTNKAADEMKERLQDLGAERDRAFIGTMHGFCLELLAERGKLVGVEGMPNIFEHSKDRREVLEKAVSEDPYLSDLLGQIEDPNDRRRQVDRWLSAISRVKTHPITCAVVDDEDLSRALDAYEAGMRACGAYDFDDLLLLSYRLFTENPKLGDIYRRLYKFVCIDEAQDMNEAQYALITALCGDTHRNIMMVGDPRQSIYGFNTAGPEYMEKFASTLGAKRIYLTANYRSSQAVVSFAQSLDSNYMVAMQLPVAGSVTVIPGDSEEDEAVKVVNELERLLVDGHPDVEGGVQLAKCAVLGRTRFALLAIEAELKERGIAFYKRLSANHENESEIVEAFQLALRVLANPKDRLHLAALAKKWKVAEPAGADFVSSLAEMASSSKEPGTRAVREAIEVVARNTARLDLMPAFKVLQTYADGLDEAQRLAIYEDTAVLSHDWDQFLRSTSGMKTLNAFLSSKALGSTQRASRSGVALLTVHSSKGLEFDVVFIAGMAEGTFPDYRATAPKEKAEEVRNAFVAATRSKRLLYLSYPRSRVMPWGGVRRQMPSQFLQSVPG